MSNLANYVKQNFKGMLVFGDIHSDYESLMKAHKFATDNDLFFMSLGDLVDRGPFPFETVSHMAKFIDEGKAGFTSGNHDTKFYKFAQGEKVNLSVDARRTIADVGPERMDEFLRLYTKVFTAPMFSDLFHTFDDIILVHAASHPSMWNPRAGHSNTQLSRALYGEVNGERHDNGFPVRLYNWIDEVPMGKTVIVGHDRAPIHMVAITEPMVKTNSNGGKVIFMDTGCGKGGFLSGAVILHNKKHFKFDSFVDFK
jgi:hypothetical protein